MKRVAWLTALILAAACSSSLASDGPRRGSVSFAIGFAGVNAPSGPFVSVLDSVRLSVTQTGNATPLVRRAAKLARRDTVVTFTDIELFDGTYSFTATVTSVNGAVLFDSTRKTDVREDNFVVDLPVGRRAPVLLLAPDTVRVGTSLTFVVQVHNRGLPGLTWSIGHDAGPNCGCAVVMGPTGGNLGALLSDSVRVTVRKSTNMVIRLTATSKEGNVSVVLQ